MDMVIRAFVAQRLFKGFRRHRLGREIIGFHLRLAKPQSPYRPS
jgi:hypothetical protein